MIKIGLQEYSLAESIYVSQTMLDGLQRRNLSWVGKIDVNGFGGLFFSYVYGLGALICLGGLESDGFPFYQSLETFAGDIRVMDEIVVSVLAGYKAVAFLLIEPFDGYFHYHVLCACHFSPFAIWKLSRKATG